MENIVLNAVTRNAGKTNSKQLRNSGMIPAVVYGGKSEISVAVSAQEFNAKFKIISESQIIQLAVADKNYQVIIKDYQKDFMRDKMIHIDFLELTKGHELKTHIPLKVVGAGSTPGEKLGGILDVVQHELEVVCLPKDLPSEIEVNVSELGLDMAFHVSDLKVPAGVKILNSVDTVLVVINHPKGEKAEAVEETTEA